MTGTRWLSGHYQSVPNPEPEDDHVIRLNPLYYWEEREVNQEQEQSVTTKQNEETTATKKNNTLFVYWNPDFVASISIQGRDLTPDCLEYQKHKKDLRKELQHELQQQFSSWQNDRSLPVSTTISPQKETAPDLEKDKEDEGNQSDDSSDIDEELFAMKDIPEAPAEPKLLSKNSRHSRIFHDDIIKELSQKLASSRERQLLMTVVSKSQRFHSMKAAIPDFSFYHHPMATSSTPSTWKAPKHHFANNVRVHSALVQPAVPTYGSLPDFTIPSYHYKSRSSSLVGSLTSRPTALGPLAEENVSVSPDEHKAGPASSNGNAIPVANGDALDSKVCDPSMHPSVLPVLKELDLLLSKSRTLQTFKLKVRQAQEQMTLAELGHVDIEAAPTVRQTNSSIPSWVPKTMLKKQRLWQVGFAVLLLLLFLAMLVGLSVCCSTKQGQ